MVEDTFAAAHALRGYKGKCENLHGHTFRIQAFIAGAKLNDIGIMMDFHEIKRLLKNILDRFDHKDLCEISEFKIDNPSSENIAKVVFNELKRDIKELNKVTVWESSSTCASYFDPLYNLPLINGEMERSGRGGM